MNHADGSEWEDYSKGAVRQLRRLDLRD